MLNDSKDDKLLYFTVQVKALHDVKKILKEEKEIAELANKVDNTEIQNDALKCIISIHDIIKALEKDLNNNSKFKIYMKY